MQVLCKPKILPLKSVTLEKLEEMEARMAELAKQAPM
jgi:Cilia BBSome complex subunit 10